MFMIFLNCQKLVLVLLALSGKTGETLAPICLTKVIGISFGFDTDLLALSFQKIRQSRVFDDVRGINRWIDVDCRNQDKAHIVLMFTHFYVLSSGFGPQNKLI
jgi:hypothetical protein